MSCPLCGSAKSGRYARDFYKLGRQVYSLLRCKQCGLVFVSPFPSEKDIAAMYSGSYFDDCYDSGMSSAGYFENREKLTERYRKVLAGIMRYKRSGKLLEVGCAGGIFLELAKKQGFEPEGVEISAEMSAKALGFKVFTGTLEQAKFPSSSFDIVYMGHVLEHVTNPKAMVKEAFRVLRSNGLLVVEVPAFVNSFYYLLLRAFYSIIPLAPLPFFKIAPKGKYLKPYHLLEFSPRTLKMLLQRQGFRVARLEQSIPVPDSLSPVLQPVFAALKLLVKLGFRGGSLAAFAVKGALRERTSRIP